jgi:hypothetical protein
MFNPFDGYDDDDDYDIERADGNDDGGSWDDYSDLDYPDYWDDLIDEGYGVWEIDVSLSYGESE